MPKENKGNEKTKKGIGKWCDFHKIPWHNTHECHLKQSLVVVVEILNPAGDDLH